MVKILLFSSLYPHAAEPTLGIFVENRLRRLLADQPVEARVVAPVPWFPFTAPVFGRYARAACAPVREDRDGIQVMHPRFPVIPKLGMSLTPLGLARVGLTAARSIRARGFDFDLIDAHYLYPDGVAAARMGDALGRPVVMTARGSDVTEIGRQLRARRVILEALERAAHVNAVSNSLRDELIEIGVPATKITTVRNGVDLERYRQVHREVVRERLGLSGPVMMFAGWLIPRKRVDLVLGVTGHLENCTTLLLGDGPLRGALERQARELGISHRVRFLGQKRPEELVEYYNAADAFLLLSDREGWANVLLESMACGTPVVSRAVGGAPDLITRRVAGRLVDSTDVEVIASAVRDLLSSAPSREAVRAFAADFDWSGVSAQQMEIFRNALSARGSIA